MLTTFLELAIDQATLCAVDDTSVWCDCDVIGLNATGEHINSFFYTPNGQCILTITRCPTSSHHDCYHGNIILKIHCQVIAIWHHCIEL